MKKLKSENITKLSMPWHGWLLGIIFLLYGLAAAFDSFMAFTQGEVYFKANGMSEMQINYFSNIPLWADLGMTICVWGGLFASILLLMRKPVSKILFLTAVISNLFFIFYAYFLSDGVSAMGMLWAMPVIITVLMIGMVFYCQRLTRLNVLV